MGISFHFSLLPRRQQDNRMNNTPRWFSWNWMTPGQNSTAKDKKPSTEWILTREWMRGGYFPCRFISPPPQKNKNKSPSLVNILQLHPTTSAFIPVLRPAPLKHGTASWSAKEATELQRSDQRCNWTNDPRYLLCTHPLYCMYVWFLPCWVSLLDPQPNRQSRAESPGRLEKQRRVWFGGDGPQETKDTGDKRKTHQAAKVKGAFRGETDCSS